MRKVTKDVSNIPASLTAQQNDLKNINKENSDKLKYDSQDVKDALQGIYKGKCAFCENTDVLEIEHYRPKNNVHSKDLARGQKPAQAGYFWLRIEWTNLLYACHACNRTGAKGTHFPLENAQKRVLTPVLDAQGLPTNTNITDLDQQEKPLLINPEITEPRKHLKINYLGNIVAVNQSKHGAKSIEVYDLKRENLNKRRSNIIQGFREDILQQLKFYYQNDNPLNIKQLKQQLFAIFEKIAKNDNATEPFTLVAYSILTDIENVLLIDSDFLPEHKRLVLDIFLEFCS